MWRLRFEKISLPLWLLLIFIFLPTGYTYVYDIDYIELIVYRDGLVHVVESLTCNETYPAITIKLLASKVENVLVLDENDSLIDYEISGVNMSIFSLGAGRILIEYDTFELTSMEAGVWTLKFDSPFNLTVKLPEEATIVYLNNIPLMISVEGNKTILYLSAGSWEISYVLPVSIPSKPPSSSETSPPSEEVRYSIELIAFIIVGVLAFPLTAFLLYRKRRIIDISQILKGHPELRDDERKVLEFIVSRGGKVFEAELRKAFPEIPRTTLWRMIKRLERKNILNVKKIGMQNQVELRYK